MDWDKVYQLLQIAELSRGYGTNSPVKGIHDAAVHELELIAAAPIEITDETGEPVEAEEEPEGDDE